LEQRWSTTALHKPPQTSRFSGLGPVDTVETQIVSSRQVQMTMSSPESQSNAKHIYIYRLMVKEFGCGVSFAGVRSICQIDELLLGRATCTCVVVFLPPR